MTSTTRRGALKGLATAAAAATMPSAALGSVLTDRSAWDAAMAAYVRAKADAKLHNYSDYWGDLESDAASLLITTPAPDGPALLFKLEYLFGDVEREPDGYGASYCGEWMSAIMADARRLLSAGRA